MPSEVEQILHQCPNCSVMLDVTEQEPFSEIRCPSCDVSMRVRKQFNNFELVEVIASGGMGTVYKARDVNLNRIVALKLLRKEYSADQDYIEKLETEAKITASVNHPHVVKVFSFGSDYGQYYIAMELVDKGSLDDLMNLQGRIAEVQVLEIGVQAAMGLRAALHAGLIHRDVKPGNILFADAHTAKIVDFGLAVPLEQAQEETGGDIWGTPYYVAPEKLNHEPEDFRSDIYSLGGTLFHALAGRPPFEAENASLVALKHLKSQAVSLQAFAPDISSPTSYVINRTLAKNPDERYQSYDELIEHLEYARSQLLENGGKRQQKVRVVVEGAEQQEAFGYINMAIIAFVILLGIVLFIFRDTILSQHLSVQELEERRAEKGMSVAEQLLSDSRKRLIDGDTKGAYSALKELEDRPNLSQPVMNWVLLNEGLAAHACNLASEGRAAFNRLRANGLYSSMEKDAKLANFFVDVGRLMADEKPLGSSAGKDYMTSDFQPIALLAFALKDWEAAQFEDAASLFQAFVSTDPKESWSWIGDYKPLAKRYLDDYDAYSDLADKIKAATSTSEQAALLPRFGQVKAKLRLPGKLPDQINTYERIFKFATSPNICGWTGIDIGEVGKPGKSSYTNGTYLVEGAGRDIWGTSDGFRFLCQQISGDCSIVARLVSTTDTHKSSKAGVMMRETINSDSRHVSFLFQQPKGVVSTRRPSSHAATVEGTAVEFDLPCWIKLVRSKNRFEGFASKDGQSWTSLGGATTVTMNASIYVGLAVCSRDPGMLKPAEFDNATVRLGSDSR